MMGYLRKMHIGLLSFCPNSFSWFYYLALVNRELLPVGSAYVAHVRRVINNHTFEQHDELAEEQRRLALLNGNGENEEDDLGVGDEPESDDLLLLDPKEWKVRF